MLLLLVTVGVRVKARRDWRDQHLAVEAMIHELQQPIPNECTPEGWRMAVGQTDIAFGNIAFDPTYISTSELALLKEDLKKMIADTVPSPVLLREIYNRLGRCNKTTAVKSEKWRALFTEIVERSYKHRTSKPVDI